MSEKPEEKIIIYQNELSNLIKQVAAKRTELATLAKTRLETLQPEISNLEAKKAQKEKELADLGKAIEQRKAQYNSEKVSCQAEFDRARNNLEVQYRVKTNSVDEKERELDSLIAEYRNNLELLSNRQEHLNVQENAIKRRLAEADNEKKIAGEILREAEKSKRQASIEATARLTDAERALEAALRTQKEADNLKLDLCKRLNDADIIIMRINEANIILDEAKRIQMDNAVREKDLNEQRVKNIADRQKNNRKAEELASLEVKLNERERNIEIAEQGVK